MVEKPSEVDGTREKLAGNNKKRGDFGSNWRRGLELLLIGGCVGVCFGLALPKGAFHQLAVGGKSSTKKGKAPAQTKNNSTQKPPPLSSAKKKEGMRGNGKNANKRCLCLCCLVFIFFHFSSRLFFLANFQNKN